MAWEKSKAFLEKVQISSIVLYLICLGGYAIPVDALHEVYDAIRADIFGFAFFSLFAPRHQCSPMCLPRDRWTPPKAVPVLARVLREDRRRRIRFSQF